MQLTQIDKLLPISKNAKITHPARMPQTWRLKGLPLPASMLQFLRRVLSAESQNSSSQSRSLSEVQPCSLQAAPTPTSLPPCSPLLPPSRPPPSPSTQIC